MMTTPDKSKKKYVIINLLLGREGLLSWDVDFGFRLDDILWLTYEDINFYYQVMEILDSQMHYHSGLYRQVFKHLDTSKQNVALRDRILATLFDCDQSI